MEEIWEFFWAASIQPPDPIHGPLVYVCDEWPDTWLLRPCDHSMFRPLGPGDGLVRGLGLKEGEYEGFVLGGCGKVPLSDHWHGLGQAWHWLVPTKPPPVSYGLGGWDGLGAYKQWYESYECRRMWRY